MCMLGNGTSCLGVRTVGNGNGKANEDKKKMKRSRREHGSVVSGKGNLGRVYLSLDHGQVRRLGWSIRWPDRSSPTQTEKA